MSDLSSGCMTATIIPRLPTTGTAATEPKPAGAGAGPESAPSVLSGGNNPSDDKTGHDLSGFFLGNKK
jgi:hypothetical protein